jgi:WXXGXW repeat (2 copies)
MSTLRKRFGLLTLLGSALFPWLAGAGAVGADDAPGKPPEAQEQADPNMDVLLRGPLHEAFANQVDLSPAAGLIVPKTPPAAIDELPPEQRPEGENVQWIPGYWAWDDAAKDYLWISGLWRNIPPDRRWVPGYWAEADGGWRWTLGAWVPAATQTVQYLPEPQPTLERGPSTEAPSADYVWAPGCWIYRGTSYQWRPGFWMLGQPGWVWIPDHYAWTPGGVLFVSGYWDYELDNRGLAFCPVMFHGTPYLAHGWHYRPSVVIATDLLLLHLWVRPSHGHYYFGDYYHADFGRAGFSPWYDVHAYHYGYDPMLAHYRWDHARRGIDVVARLQGWHDFYQKKPDLRPPHVMPVGPHVGPDLLHDLTAHAKTQPPVLGMSLAHLAAAPQPGNGLVKLTPQDVNRVGASTGSMNSLLSERRGVEMGRAKAGPKAGAGKTDLGPATANVGKKPDGLKLPDAIKPFGGGLGTTGAPTTGGVAGAAGGKRRPPPNPQVTSKDLTSGVGAGKTTLSPQGAVGGADAGKTRVGPNLVPKDLPSAAGAGKKSLPQTGVAGGTDQGKKQDLPTIQPRDQRPRGQRDRSFQPQPGNTPGAGAGKLRTDLNQPPAGKSLPSGVGTTIQQPARTSGTPGSVKRQDLTNPQPKPQPSMSGGAKLGQPSGTPGGRPADRPRGNPKPSDKEGRDKKPGR